MIAQMLAHSLRKAHIKILFVFYFYFQSTESSCQGTGGGAGRVAPHDFVQQLHPMCIAQLDTHVGLYSEASISSPQDTELQSVPWESHNGATLRDGHVHQMEEKSLSWRAPSAAQESFANMHTGELEICTAKMGFFTRPKPAPQFLTLSN